MGRVAQWLCGTVILCVLVLGAGLFWPQPLHLRIAIASELRDLAPVVEKWAKSQEIEIDIVFSGSIDLASYTTGESDFVPDALWPAHRLWVDTATGARRGQDVVSIAQSPVVLGLRPAVASRLGWQARDDLSVAQIAQMMEDGALRLALPEATRSHAGASSFVALVEALSTQPTPAQRSNDVRVLASSSDASSELQNRVERLVAGLTPLSGAPSEWMHQVVSLSAGPEGLLASEVVVRRINRTLRSQGRPTLQVFRLTDMPRAADYPFIVQSEPTGRKRRALLDLQSYLTSPAVQQDLLNRGWRLGTSLRSAPQRARAVDGPSAQDIRALLRRFDSVLRQPTLTVWLLDVSGSMQGDRIGDLRSAMARILEPDTARHSGDVNVVLPFRQRPDAAIEVLSGDQDSLHRAQYLLKRLEPSGSADMYLALTRAMDVLQPYDQTVGTDPWRVSIVIVTDSASDVAHRDTFLHDFGKSVIGQNLQIHTVALPGADMDQLRELSRMSDGKVIPATGPLYPVLQHVRGAP